MICREGARASNRFERLRCLRSTVPKGARQNDSGARRMGIYFYFVGPGAVADPEEDGGGGMGPCLSPGAPVRAYPLGHQPGILFGLERAIPKGPGLDSNGPFLVPRDCIGPMGQFHKKTFIPKREKFLFSVGPIQFQEALFSFRGS